MDACPACGGWNWYRRTDGTPVCLDCLQQDERADPRSDEMAELEAARREREVSMAAIHMSADNPSYCLFCETPLLEGESYEIIPGAELCGECMARPDDCDNVRQISRHRAALEHYSKSETGDAGDELSSTFAGGVVEKRPVPLVRGAATSGQMTGLPHGSSLQRESSALSSPASPASVESLTPRHPTARGGVPRSLRRRPRVRSGRVPPLEGGILWFLLYPDAGEFSAQP
jgi:hypothetical protein